MATNTKKEWNPRITIDEALSCSVNWLVRARQKNVLALQHPTLYVAYVVEETPFLGFMQDLSSLFRYSSKDDPETDRARDQALRLLAICAKAHFFIARDALVRHEPYFFSFPDIAHPSMPHYGLVYKMETRPAQCIVVSTADLGLASSLKPNVFKFPVVLTKNSYRWFDKKHWNELLKEVDMYEHIMKPWLAKKESDIAERWTDPSTFNFGTLLDVPFELKEHMKPTGVKWADGVKKWYLPRGYDIEPVREYLNWLTTEYDQNKEQFESHFWRIQQVRREPPRAVGKQTNNTHPTLPPSIDQIKTEKN